MLASFVLLAAVTLDPRVELVTLEQDNHPVEALKLAQRPLRLPSQTKEGRLSESAFPYVPPEKPGWAVGRCGLRGRG